MDRGKAVKNYVIAILIPLAVGGLSALLTHGGMDRFEALAKPPLSPPGVVFPIVWTILYALMGISSALVWRSSSGRRRTDALFVYGAQLFVNFFWSIFFFCWELRFFSFLWLLLLIALLAVMFVRFKAIKPLAAWLQLPYLLWSLFAAYLNFGIWLLNR